LLNCLLTYLLTYFVTPLGRGYWTIEVWRLSVPSFRTKAFTFVALKTQLDFRNRRLNCPYTVSTLFLHSWYTLEDDTVTGKAVIMR